MMTFDSDFANWIANDYFEWLSDTVCEGRYHDDISFRKLLMCLHDTEFTYLIPNDENREADGIGLRRRYALLYDHMDDLYYLEGPCSVLEMMVALAIRCEEDIMSDTQIGNRTSQWFWNMIVSLGLGSQMDDRFDREYVEDVIHKFLNREYEPNGKGGLFTVRNCDYDLRNVEIWCQLNWYLDSFS